MPIFDYHCHLPVEEIADNRNFENLTRIWLNGDHYKWRAMRANGIEEHFITGKAGDFEKFEAWAATTPKTLRNPLYHWTHLELKRYFDISDKLLNSDTAAKFMIPVRKCCKPRAFSTRGILQRMNVKVVCTTDDPVDALAHHQQIKADQALASRFFRPSARIKPWG